MKKKEGENWVAKTDKKISSFSKKKEIYIRDVSCLCCIY